MKQAIANPRGCSALYAAYTIINGMGKDAKPGEGVADNLPVVPSRGIMKYEDAAPS